MQSYQVLVFQPALTHSVWQDWGSDDPLSEEEIIERLRAGVESGEYVGWRVITIHKEVMGRDEVALARFLAPKQVREENDRLRVVLGAALQDSERIDWLEKEKTDVEYRHGQGALGPGWAVWMDDAKTEKHATVRDALDAARKLQS